MNACLFTLWLLGVNDTQIGDPANQDEWRIPGFQLAMGIESFGSAGPAKTTIFNGGLGLMLRPTIHLDEQWSVAATLRYQMLHRGLSGYRWRATAGIMYHPFSSLRMLLSFGYAGMKADVDHPDVTVDDALSQGRTRDASAAALNSCDGTGAVGELEFAYLLRLGSVLATGPYISADLQWLHCEDRHDVIDSATGLASRTDQWWTTYGWGAGWMVVWR